MDFADGGMISDFGWAGLAGCLGGLDKGLLVAEGIVEVADGRAVVVVEEEVEVEVLAGCMTRSKGL